MSFRGPGRCMYILFSKSSFLPAFNAIKAKLITAKLQLLMHRHEWNRSSHLSFEENKCVFPKMLTNSFKVLMNFVNLSHSSSRKTFTILQQNSEALLSLPFTLNGSSETEIILKCWQKQAGSWLLKIMDLSTCQSTCWAIECWWRTLSTPGR